MRGNVILKLVLVFCIVFSFGISAYAADMIKFVTDPQQRLDVRYRLFKTENMWNFLELDTQTGRLWQIQFTVDKNSNRIKLPINPNPLAPEGNNGRFTLYPTNNMWNFMLVDQDNGRMWQAQFSVGDENRDIFPIFSDEETQLLLDKLPKKQK